MGDLGVWHEDQIDGLKIVGCKQKFGCRYTADHAGRKVGGMNCCPISTSLSEKLVPRALVYQK